MRRMKFAETNTKYILNSISVIKLTAKYNDKVKSTVLTIHKNVRLHITVDRFVCFRFLHSSRKFTDLGVSPYSIK